MELVKPKKDYLDSYYQGCIENWGHVHDNYIIHNPKEYENWKDTIFDDFEAQANGQNLPDGFLANITYWLIENDEYIGTVNIRPILNDALIEYGGTFGIVIKNSKRKRGYGKKAVELVFKKLKELNISPIIFTCEESNTASWHLCEYFNYKKKDLYTTMINGELTPARRYWF